MRQRRRFPLFSVLVALALGGVVGYLSFMDVDVPGRALEQVKNTIAGLGGVFAQVEPSPEGGGFGFFKPSRDDGSGAGTQAALPMLVNAKNPLPDGFAPRNLVNMREYCDSSVVYIKGNDIQGEKEAVDALMPMLRDAIAAGVGNWQISAGYRSREYQQTVWNEQVAEYQAQGLSLDKANEATGKYVAQPGASEHHTGLAFDVTVPGESFPLTEQSKWLAENCWKYGFTIRYTEEKQPITGINAEPWHIRYVGFPHSQRMHEQNLCLEEYLGAV